jgi:predicted chitinase
MDPEEQRQLLEQLNQNMAAMNTLLAQNNFLQAKSQNLTEKELKEFAVDIQNAGVALENFDKGLQARIKAEQEELRVRIQFNSALRSGVGSITSFLSAVKSAEDGIDKYEGTINQATDAIGSFAKMLPGIAGTIAEGAVQAAGTILSLTLQKYAQVIRAFDTLTPLGVTAGLTAGQIDTLGKAAGFSGTRLETFAKGAAEAGRGLQALGGTASSGLAAFSSIAAIGDDQLKQYRRLGLSQNQILEFQATYIRQLQEGGITIDKSAGAQQRLQKSSLELLTQMTALADLTGISVKEQQKGIDFANSQFNFQVFAAKQSQEAANLRLQAEQLDGEAREEALARAKTIEEDITFRRAAIAQTLAQEGQVAATAIAQMMASEKLIITEQTAAMALRMNSLAGGINEFYQRITDPKISPEERFGALLGGFQESTQEFLNSGLGYLAQNLGKAGQDIAEAFGQSGESIVSASTRFREGLSPDKYDEAITEQYRKIVGNLDKQKTTSDKFADTIATVELMERKIRSVIDNLALNLDMLNPAMQLMSKIIPLVNSENIKFAGQIALTATAATVAAVALGKLAATSLIGGGGGGGGRFGLPGTGGIVPPGGPPAGGGSRVSTILGSDGKPIPMPDAAPAAGPTVGNRIAGAFNPANLVRGLGYGALLGVGTNLAADVVGRDTGLGQTLGVAGSAASGAATLSMFGLPGMAVGAGLGGLYGLYQNMNAPTSLTTNPYAVPGLTGIGSQTQAAGIEIPDSTGLGTYDPLAGLMLANSELLKVSNSRPLPVRLPDGQIETISDQERLIEALDVNKDGVIDQLERLQGVFNQSGFGMFSPSVIGAGTGNEPIAKLPQDVSTNLSTIAASLKERGITDENYIKGALGNVLRESGGVARTEQSYANTSNERIRGIFGSTRNLGDQQLNSLKANPEQFFNYVYGSGQKAKTLGNVEPSDGFKFRGRGYIQLTGRDNYSRASKAIFNDDRLVRDPDLVNNPQVAALVTAWWFDKDRVSTAQKIFGAGVDVNKLTAEQANILTTSQVVGTDVSKTTNAFQRQSLAATTQFAGSEQLTAAARSTVQAPGVSSIPATNAVASAPSPNVDLTKPQVMSAGSAEGIAARLQGQALSKDQFFAQNVTGTERRGGRGRGYDKTVVRTQDQLEKMYAEYVQKQQVELESSAAAIMQRLVDPDKDGTKANRLTGQQEKALQDKTAFSKDKLVELYNESRIQKQYDVSLQIEQILRQRGELDKDTSKLLTDINVAIDKYNSALRPILAAEKKRADAALKASTEKANAQFLATGNAKPPTVPEANAAPVANTPPVASAQPAAAPAAPVAATGSQPQDNRSVFERVLGIGNKSQTEQAVAALSPIPSTNTAFSSTSSFSATNVPKITIEKVSVTNATEGPLNVKDVATGPLSIVSDQLNNELKSLVELQKGSMEGVRTFNSKLDEMLAKLDTLNGIQERIMKAS